MMINPILPPILPRVRILIAEDDFIINLYIETILESRGYEVVGVVSRGEEAISKAHELHPDLILMDIGLSGKINGLEAAMLIRQEQATPIVFMTGNSDLVRTDPRVPLIQPEGILIKPIADTRLLDQLSLLFPGSGCPDPGEISGGFADHSEWQDGRAGC